MITIKNLRCAYENRSIIHDFSFAFSSHLLIIGNNGSGKSTLAKALCGLISYEGNIFIQNRELHTIALKERAKLINYIPSKLESFDTFTTLKEFLHLSRYAHHSLFEYNRDDDLSIVEEKLHFLKITHLQDKFLQELSSGEQQLALIASALVQESSIIIFDEPTANLDPEHSVAFYKHLKELQKKHQTILITHDLNLASQFNDALLYMQEGEIYRFNEASTFFEKSNLEKFYHKSVAEKKGIGINYV